MKRILHYGISGNLGGIETYVQKISKNINHNKYIFDFLIQGDSIPIGFEELKNQGSKFYFVTPRRVNPVKNYFEAKKVITTNNYSLVHNHLLSLSYITPAMISMRNDIPTIIHSHSSSAPSKGFSQKLHKFNKYKIRKKDFTAIAVSKLASEWMFGGKDNVNIINNGIDTDIYKFNDEARKNIREEFNINDQIVLIHIGTLKKVKNHDFILDIFSELLKVRQDSKLIIVGGDGDMKSSVLNKISNLKLNDNVIFTGIRTDIPDLLSAADILVFPSFYEGFPGVVLEAQTSGLACVISDTITDEVVINKNCIQVSLEQPSSYWSEQTLKLLNKNLDRNDGVTNIIKNNLSVREEIKKIEKIYDEIS